MHGIVGQSKFIFTNNLVSFCIHTKMKEFQDVSVIYLLYARIPSIWSRNISTHHALRRRNKRRELLLASGGVVF